MCQNILLAPQRNTVAEIPFPAHPRTKKIHLISVEKTSCVCACACVVHVFWHVNMCIWGLLKPFAHRAVGEHEPLYQRSCHQESIAQVRSHSQVSFNQAASSIVEATSVWALGCNSLHSVTSSHTLSSTFGFPEICRNFPCAHGRLLISFVIRNSCLPVFLCCSFDDLSKWIWEINGNLQPLLLNQCASFFFKLFYV